MRNGLVIIPALNEARSITTVLNNTRRCVPAYDVLVVDDGSEDETAHLARQAGALVVRHPFNLGYGTALQTGYLYALKHGYPLAVQMDADGQHNPADLAALVEALESNRVDLVIGSRFHPDSHYRMSILKRVGSLWFGALVRLFTGLRVSDPTSGLQAISQRVLRLYATEAFPTDYPDADMLVLLHRHGFKICEVNVHMEERPESPSMHSGLKTAYYVYKMTLAILMNMARKPMDLEQQ